MAQDFALQAHQAEPLDALLWRGTGRGSGAIEAVLDANPGLAALSTALPEKHVVTVPPAALQPATAPLVQLWD